MTKNSIKQDREAHNTKKKETDAIVGSHMGVFDPVRVQVPGAGGQIRGQREGVKTNTLPERKVVKAGRRADGCVIGSPNKNRWILGTL